MDNIQVIIYIILGLIYFIAKNLKKPKAGNTGNGEWQQPTPSSENKPTYQPPASLEDLLKEFKREFQPEPKKEPVKQPEVYKKPAPYNSPFTKPSERSQEGKSLEVYDTEKKAIYEKSVREAVKVRSLEEELDTEDIATKMKKVTFHEEGIVDPVNPYRQLLQNPANVRQAIILNEILNRPYH